MRKGKKQFLTEDDIKKLTYVKVKNPNIKLDNFPDFLVIGPQRTGTTWLHSNLKKNPRIYMSTPKEIHYFSILSGRANKSLNKNFKPYLSYYLKHFNKKNIGSIKDIIKYFSNSNKLSRVKIGGESSATYALLEIEVIREILVFNPNLKIIILVRNPIERSWSHLKLEKIKNTKIPYTKKNKYLDISEISEEEIIKFFNKKFILANGYFSKIIDKWSSVINKENLFIGNFNDIKNCPFDLLRKIHNFLNIEFDNTIYKNEIEKKINASKYEEMPYKIKVFLEDKYNEEINLLRNKYKIDI